MTLTLNQTPIFPLRLEHTAFWERIQLAITHQRMSHALMLIGPEHLGVGAFAMRLAAALLCKGETKPCEQCDACHLLHVGTHPDFQAIRQDTSGGVIKIDKIRALQDDVYHTPQCGDIKVILIEPADKMNVAAANALLKILEEPPEFVYFILVVEQQGTLPPTILSRCQQMFFQDMLPDASHYFLFDSQHFAESSRAALYEKRELIMTALCELVEGKITPCTFASNWGTYELIDLVWLLYVMTAQAIQFKLLESTPTIVKTELLSRFANAYSPFILFGQLNKINSILKKLSKNISMNKVLALEDLCIGYSNLSMA